MPDRQDPDQSPDAADRPEQRAVDPPRIISGGVPLSRLLAMARLTAAQALALGAGVLEAAARETASGDGGRSDVDGFVLTPVVSPDGRVVLGPTGNGAATTGRPLGAVLADIFAAVPAPGPVAGPASDQHLAALDRAVQDLPAAGVCVVSRRLQEAAVAVDRAAVGAEIAALVRAVGIRVPGSGLPRTGEPLPAARAKSVRRASSGARSAGRHVAAWLLSGLVLGAVVVSEVVLLREDITADIGLLLDAGREGDQPSAGPEPVGPEVPAPAPAAAGSVVAVGLRPLAACAPGAPCTMRIQVGLVPAAEPQVVTWSYQVVDACTGQSGIVPGGTVTVPPQGDRAEAVGVVALPPLDGVAVLAVTAAPAAAASAPVVVGSCPSAGSGG